MDTLICTVEIPALFTAIIGNRYKYYDKSSCCMALENGVEKNSKMD